VISDKLIFEQRGSSLEAEEGREESLALCAFRLLEGWKEAARTGHALHPVATVTDFDELWPWLLTGMCYAVTRSVSIELRALT
jgi:hypothetical protein